MNIAELLRIYMAVVDVRVRDLAKQIGVSPATISRVSRGEKIDSKTMLLVINWLFQEKRTL